MVIALDPQGTRLQWGHLAALITALVGAANHLIVRMTGGIDRVVVLQIYPFLALLLVAGPVLPFVYVPMRAADLGLTAAMGLAGYLLIIAAYQRAPAIVVARCSKARSSGPRSLVRSCFRKSWTFRP